MRIKLIGKGKMGEIFFSLFKDEIVEQVEFSNDLNPHILGDIIVDFSNRLNLQSLLNYAIDNKMPLVIATTGYSDKEKSQIKMASKMIPICLDSNFSMGINILKKSIFPLAKLFNDVLIYETHHITKKDKPSGTALMLKEYIENINKNISVKIFSKRKEDICGIHKIIFKSFDEKVTLIHQANNRLIFAKGAYVAAEKMLKKRPGFYIFSDLVEEKK